MEVNQIPQTVLEFNSFVLPAQLELERRHVKLWFRKKIYAERCTFNL